MSGSSSPATGPGRRLRFVDGLRGIAALVVLIGHTIGMVPPDHPVTTFGGANLEHKLLWPFLFGGQMVWLFILLSGFALYWSEEDRRARGPATPLGVYVRRRAWRILPTYLVSLALGLLVVGALGAVLVAPSPSLDTYGPVTGGGVIAHLLLVHNLNGAWFSQINPPLWSIAVEAQLYLLFPALAAASFRWRPFLPVAAAFVAVAAANAALPVPVFPLFLWFGAGIVVAHVARRHAISRPVLAATAGLSIAVGGYAGPAAAGHLNQLVWLTGCAAVVLLLAGGSPRTQGRGPRLASWLGGRSYSLYAVHFPVVLLVWAGVGRLGLAHVPALLVQLAVALPLALAAAAACHRLVEQPSLAKVRAAGARPQGPANGPDGGQASLAPGRQRTSSPRLATRDRMNSRSDNRLR